MATTLFKDTTYSAFGLIEDIKQGEVALYYSHGFTG